jgi:hypothetical protein
MKQRNNLFALKSLTKDTLRFMTHKIEWFIFQFTNEVWRELMVVKIGH